MTLDEWLTSDDPTIFNDNRIVPNYIATTLTDGSRVAFYVTTMDYHTPTLVGQFQGADVRIPLDKVSEISVLTEQEYDAY